MRSAVAFHEAGHAIAAVRLGVPFRRVRLRWLGLAGCLERAGTDDAHRLAVIVAAGPAAQAIYQDRPVPAVIETGRGSDGAKLLLLEEHIGHDAIARAASEADTLIRDGWRDVSYVARLLLTRRTVTPADLGRLPSVWHDRISFLGGAINHG